MENIKKDYDKKKNIFFKEQKKKGIDQVSKNATHHTIIHCDSLFELLKENIVHKILSIYFNSNKSVYIEPIYYIYRISLHTNFFNR